MLLLAVFTSPSSGVTVTAAEGPWGRMGGQDVTPPRHPGKGRAGSKEGRVWRGFICPQTSMMLHGQTRPTV